MLISKFAKAAELSVDTVRFYVRLGLLKPEQSNKGGSRPYLLFSPSDLDRVMKIRILQALGYPLKEIGYLVEEDAKGLMTPERSKVYLNEQLGLLGEKRDHIDRLIAFIVDRIKSLDDADPQLPDFRKYMQAEKPKRK